MSAPAFAPGPWLVDPDHRPDMEWNRHIRNAAGDAICFMAHSDGRNPDRDEANAYVIAASPTMHSAIGEAIESAGPLASEDELVVISRESFQALTDAYQLALKR